MASTENPIYDEFDKLLSELGVNITRFDETKTRSIITTRGNMAETTLLNRMEKTKKFNVYPNIFYCIGAGTFNELLQEYLNHKGLAGQAEVPDAITEQRERFQDYILCKNIVYTDDKEPTFFLLTPKEVISGIPAHHFIDTFQLENPSFQARPLIKEYCPRDKQGIFLKEIISEEVMEHVNSYVVPKWMKHEEEVPDKLPPEIEKLCSQIIDEKDRLFFFHWLYQSLTTKASVYLILQADPAVGKNRLKIMIRALHGHNNSVDGKKSTLTTQFNGQLSGNTYLHFDELKFSYDEENIMKEIPNGTMSIENKHQDATRSSRIHCSMVISNNKPRDNYIAFDARKFAPIKMSSKRLETVMTPEEINRMSVKMEFDDDAEFDVGYIAQIGRWILKHGNRPDLFPVGEHRGPKFWELAFSSMFAWQKATIKVLSEIEKHSRAPEMHLDMLNKGTILFSDIQNIAAKSKNIRVSEGDFPADYSTAMHFLTIFRGLNGEKVFEVSPTEDKFYGDFFVKKIPTSSSDEDDL